MTPSAVTPGRRAPLRRAQSIDHLHSKVFNVWHNGPIRAMAQAHTHANIELNYPLTDPISYLHGGVRRTIEPGTLAVFWAGIPHQLVEPTATAEGIWVDLPLAWFLQWKLPNEFAARLLAGDFFTFQIERGVLAHWPAEHESKDSRLQRLLQLELQTMLTRLAVTLPPKVMRKKEREDIDGGDRHIARVTAFLAQNYAECLTVDDIAREARLHRTYLMHLFRRRCQMSLWEYVTRLRVSHAQRLLTTTSLRVSDVALECGFASLASFYYAFTRYSQIKPVAFRRQQNLADSLSCP